RRRLAIILVRRVQVRRRSGELARARVHHVVRRPHAERVAQLPHLPLRHAPQLRQLPVAEAQPLHAPQLISADALQSATAPTRISTRSSPTHTRSSSRSLALAPAQVHPPPLGFN